MRQLVHVAAGCRLLDPLQTLANHAMGALDRVASTYKFELVVNPLMKPDLAALVATLTMFLGVVPGCPRLR